MRRLTSTEEIIRDLDRCCECNGLDNLYSFDGHIMCEDCAKPIMYDYWNGLPEEEKKALDPTAEEDYCSEDWDYDWKDIAEMVQASFYKVEQYIPEGVEY